MPDQVTKQEIKRLFLDPVLERKSELGIVLLGSLVVSMTQASIVFIFGPVFSALFNVSKNPTLRFTDVLPSSFAKLLPDQSFELIQAFLYLPFILAGIALTRGFSLYLTQLYQERISLRVADHFRTASFSRIISSSYLKISEKSAAEWMSHIMNDVMFLQQRFSELAKSLIKDGLAILGSLAALAFINWKLTLLLLLLCLPAVYLLGIASRKIAGYTEIVQKKLATLSSHSSDFVARFVDITFHAGQKTELSTFNQENKALFESQKRSIALRSAFAPSIEWLGFIVFSGFLYVYSRKNSLSLELDPTFMMQFVIALGLCIRPLRNLGEQISKLQETRGALSENFQLFWQEASKQKKYRTRSADNILPLTLNQFNLKYKNGVTVGGGPVSINKGDAIVITGASGSGKSSFLRCIAGLIEPDVWEASQDWELLLAETSFVSQVPFVFDDTFRKNILYGGTQATDKEIIQFAAELGLDMLIKTPKDLDRDLSSYSSEISGGQKQRLTLLRSLLQRKPILLLDEATSALDQENEKLVLNLVSKYYRTAGGAFIFVTHRAYSEEIFNKHWHFDLGKLQEKVTSTS